LAKRLGPSVGPPPDSGQRQNNAKALPKHCQGCFGARLAESA
jgi:hypothetical protein